MVTTNHFISYLPSTASGDMFSCNVSVAGPYGLGYVVKQMVIEDAPRTSPTTAPSYRVAPERFNYITGKK